MNFKRSPSRSSVMPNTEFGPTVPTVLKFEQTNWTFLRNIDKLLSDYNVYLA
jgi:hypothetical protein